MDAHGGVGGEAAAAQPAVASSATEALPLLQAGRAEGAAAVSSASRRACGGAQTGSWWDVQGGAAGQGQEANDEGLCDLVYTTDDEAEPPGPGPAGPGVGADIGGGGGSGVSLAQQLAGLRCCYPPDDAKHGVEVTADDLARLEPRQFLNDTCIDFYIKWVHACNAVRGGLHGDRRVWCAVPAPAPIWVGTGVGGMHVHTVGQVSKMHA